ncbi:hypothetical protein Tco_0358338, partial [Tanacetum coccineum]
MKRKLEEMESENHENFPLVMEMVKGYCEEKEEKKKEPEEDKKIVKSYSEVKKEKKKEL